MSTPTNLASAADDLAMAFRRSIRAAVRALVRGADAARPDDVDVDARERWVERAVAAAFMACAMAMALTLDGVTVGLPVLAWFVGLTVVLLQIEFEVGEGRTRPVQLVLIPMLLVLPAALVPGLVALANLLARLPDAVRTR